MAALRVKDLKINLGAATGAVAQAGTSMRDMARSIDGFGKALREMPKRELERNTRDARGLVRALEQQGWTRNQEYGSWNWWSPDVTYKIPEEGLVANPEAAEEVFANWLDVQTFKAKAVPPDMKMPGFGPQFVEPIPGKRYIKAEPDDPLRWLDAQVEAVCKAGRL